TSRPIRRGCRRPEARATAAKDIVLSKRVGSGVTSDRPIGRGRSRPERPAADFGERIGSDAAERRRADSDRPRDAPSEPLAARPPARLLPRRARPHVPPAGPRVLRAPLVLPRRRRAPRPLGRRPRGDVRAEGPPARDPIPRRPLALRAGRRPHVRLPLLGTILAADLPPAPAGLHADRVSLRVRHASLVVPPGQVDPRI